MIDLEKKFLIENHFLTIFKIKIDQKVRSEILQKLQAKLGNQELMMTQN